jgi:hypothetical protein
VFKTGSSLLVFGSWFFYSAAPVKFDREIPLNIKTQARLLYPIKPKPGLNGDSGLRSTAILKTNFLIWRQRHEQ